jgi:hypothetical protein
MLASVPTVFGYGQGLVMALLSNAVLGALDQRARVQVPGRLALFAACALFALSIAICVIFLTWMRRVAD